MRKIAEFIVKRHWLFLIIFAAVIVYCVFGIPKVKVEYDISNYLPSDTDTAQALKIMDAEFAEYGTATVLVRSTRTAPQITRTATRCSACTFRAGATTRRPSWRTTKS